MEAVAADAMSPCAAQVASTCEWLSLKLRQKWRTDFCTYWAVPGSSRSNGKLMHPITCDPLHQEDHESPARSRTPVRPPCAPAANGHRGVTLEGENAGSGWLGRL